MEQILLAPVGQSLRSPLKSSVYAGHWSSVGNNGPLALATLLNGRGGTFQEESLSHEQEYRPLVEVAEFYVLGLIDTILL